MFRSVGKKHGFLELSEFNFPFWQHLAVDEPLRVGFWLTMMALPTMITLQESHGKGKFLPNGSGMLRRNMV
jgi:hypothetical protein